MQNNILTHEKLDMIELGFRKADCKSMRDNALFQYALELITNLSDALDRNKIISSKKDMKKYMLNNAKNWQHYSESGNSLCYTYQLLERMFTKSQREHYPDYKIYNGELIKSQAHFLAVACYIICLRSGLPNE